MFNENNICSNQDLNLIYVSKIFWENHINFTITLCQELGLTDKDRHYTDLVLLLSDECPYTIECLIFDGNNITLKDRKEFTGSIFKQLDDVLEYLKQINRTRPRRINHKRIDIPDYPEFALRETILNAIIHRNYTFSGSILIYVFDSKIEIESLGGLVSGITINDIMSGVSQPRNKNLANIFYKLKYIQNCGIGIGRMIDIYSEFNLKPEFSVTEKTFKVILPNVNYKN